MANGRIEKQPSEKFFIGIDTSDEIIDGDSLDLGTSIVKEFKKDSEGLWVESSGGNEEILDTDTLRVATGNILEATVSGGLNQEQFKISFQAHTLNGDIFEGDIIVSIKEK